MLKRILPVVVFAFFIVVFSCNKKKTRIPYAPIDLYLNLNLPSYTNLNVIGGWIYVSGGSKGLVVYRQTTDSFSVYDRHCTFDVEAPCNPATVDSTNLALSCDCDGSKYQLYDGAVINGPATYGLQQYNSNYDAPKNSLHIYN